MDCHCNSKALYSEASQSKFYLFDQQVLPARRIPQPKPVLSPFQHKLLDQLSELSSFWSASTIEQIQFSEIRYNPLSFYKKFVSKNCPCIITGCLQGEDITERWRDYGYLKEVLESRQITVAATPDGFADSIKRDCFVEPFDIKMTMGQFLEYRDKYPGIEYVQNQNNSLVREFDVLEYEYPADAVKFIGENIFESKPDACNFWMGRSESVSSIHKDPYDNLYQVINGQKHFTLIPPIGIRSLSEGDYRRSRWQLMEDKTWKIKTSADKSRWVSNNPDLQNQLTLFPELEELVKFHVVVKEGEMLYLPALWYHQVSQFHKNPNQYIIAVNHWFDMEFTHNHTLYELTRAISGHPC